MRIHHRRLHIFVAQEFLHRPDVVALLEQMRRKAVPQGVTTDAFGEPCRTTGPTDGPLQPTLMGVMPADDPRPWVFDSPLEGKTYGQIQRRPARGYLRSRANGQETGATL
jgi:hypothetical protein